MKILITGKNSYIGNSFFEWVKTYDSKFKVDQISLRNINLNKISFKEYDVIFHVAGIAHITSNKKLIPEYFRVNRDLAIEVAKKAKKEGVRQFVFTSSIAIYGNDLPIGEIKPIDINNPIPKNAYGQSKLEADLEIQKLSGQTFKTVILRIPMVYGPNSKGNFPKLEKIANKLAIYPNIINRRSVIHIGNLNRLIFGLILNSKFGVFYPQDKKYFCTIDYIKSYRNSLKKNSILIPFTKVPLYLIGIPFKSINKIFGNKFFLNEVSTVPGIDYQKVDFLSYIDSK